MVSPIKVSDRVFIKEADQIDSKFNTIEKHWLNQVSSLPEKKQNDLIQQINALANEIRSQIIDIYQSNDLPAKEFTLRSNQQIHKFNCLCQKFFGDSILYDADRTNSTKKHDAFTETIKNTSSNLAPFQKRTREREMLDNDSLWVIKKSNIDQNIATAEVLSAAFKVVAIPIELALEGIKIAADSFCNANDTTQAVCKKAEDIFDAGMESASLKTGLNKMAAVHKENKSTMSTLLEQDYAVPKQTGEQYIDNASTVTLNMVSLGTTFGLVAGARKFLGKNQPIAPITTLESVQAASEVSGEASRLTYSNSVPQNYSFYEKTTNVQNTQNAQLSFAKVSNDNELIKSSLNPMIIPDNFPTHLSDFFSKSSVYNFTKTNVGREQMGKVTGNLLYQKLSDDSALFLIQYSSTTRSFFSGVRSTVHHGEMVKSKLVGPNEKLSIVLDATLNFSKESGFKRIYFAWNHEKIPLEGGLKKLGQQIESSGTFSVDLNEKKLHLIEIVVPD